VPIPNVGAAIGSPMAVLFDMDGVVVLSNPAHLAAWQLFGREKLGLDITPAMFYQAISGRKNEEALADLFPGRFAPEELARMSAEKEAYYRKHFGPQLEAVPGVLHLIGELTSPPVSAHTLIALATSGPPENVEFVLNRFSISQAFRVVVNGAHVTRAKPDPAIYLLAADRLQVAPSRCVVLEDAFAGVEAAKRAGMRCLALSTSEPTERLRLAGADQVLPDLSGITWRHLAAMLDGDQPATN
jgi:beta-phosphoglucomutase